MDMTEVFVWDYIWGRDEAGTSYFGIMKLEQMGITEVFVWDI